jgi:hypothetical protein
VVDHLPSKCEALSSNPSTAKKKKKRKKRQKNNLCEVISLEKGSCTAFDKGATSY